ncbi:MAG: helix-turn-helix domain-containing protein [Altibacter sp.]|uniref:helix-turn-helix domain-containing protein n=1 Tax=Altibacter sp. TaxID=2024823 RepID=UPI001DD7A8CA|nr:helix-turn-helix domain-containing protein [Altibacter sp.]MBZ0328264.1 helix-turn-helix domain-containing protein [Altibacter sp.]
MGNNDSHLVLLSIDKLQSLLNPVLNKLVVIEKYLNNKATTHKVGYYRNKDLKEKLGLSPNTIIKYRESGVIPFTMIGEVYLYPIKQIDDILKMNSNWDLFQNKAS